MIDFDKQIQEEMNWVKDEVDYMENDKELKEGIKNKDPIIESFQKNNLKKKIQCDKKSIKLYEKALVSEGTEKLNLVREAMLAELEGTNKYDLSQIETNIKSWPKELKEEFETFKNNF